MSTRISPRERACLRTLAGRLAEIADQPGQQANRHAWTAHNDLQPAPPRVLCFPEGAWLECLPPETLQCDDPLLRGWETRLRMAIYTHEHLRDDQVQEAVFNVPWDIGFTDWGVSGTLTVPDADTRRTYYLHPDLHLSLQSSSTLGAWHQAPPLTARIDPETLRPQEVIVNEATSHHWLALAHELFDGILTVRRRGNPWLLIGGFPATAVALRGMDALMLDMFDDPAWVHAFFAFLAASHQHGLDMLEAGGYLTLNNGSEWIGTGGIGYTRALPADGDPARVRCRDVWGGLQAQDLVGLSPAMFAEFLLPYLRPIMERFGLAHYGCCEAVQGWLPHLKTIANLRRVSISPFSDVPQCAAALGDRYVCSYKPSPTALSTAGMDEADIRAELIAALTHFRRHGCHVEIIMKDLHTVRHEPARLTRWVALAREAVDAVYGGEVG
jgi:hypothetical protein